MVSATDNDSTCHNEAQLMHLSNQSSSYLDCNKSDLYDYCCRLVTQVVWQQLRRIWQIYSKSRQWTAHEAGGCVWSAETCHMYCPFQCRIIGHDKRV